MADVTDTIGTSSRDFSTMTLWEASLSAHSGDNVTGDCYDDSAFDEVVTFDDATPASVVLQAAAGEQHDGTAGTGVRIVRTGDGQVVDTSKLDLLDFIEVDVNGNRATSRIVSLPIGTVNHLLLHGTENSAGSTDQALEMGNTAEALNTTIYDIVNTAAGGGSNVYGIDVIGTNSTTDILNCTIHAITNNNGGGACYGIQEDSTGGSSAHNTQNTIVTDVGGTTSGSKACFEVSDGTGNSTYDHNLSSDSTASGTGSLTIKSAANQFVSIVGGSEDLHLKTGADAIDAGIDLGTTPSGVEIDIDGRDRDAEADVWDMGANELVAGGGGSTILPHMMQLAG